MCSTTLEIRSVQLFRGPGRTAKGGNYGFVRTPLPRETGKHPGQALRWAGALAGWCGPRDAQRVLVYRAPRVPWRSPAWAWSSHRPHSLPWHAQAVQVPALGSSVRATRPALDHTDLPLGASFMVCVMRVSTFIGTLLKKSPRFGGHYWLSLFCFMNGGCGDQWR